MLCAFSLLSFFISTSLLLSSSYLPFRRDLPCGAGLLCAYRLLVFSAKDIMMYKDSTDPWPLSDKFVSCKDETLSSPFVGGSEAGGLEEENREERDDEAKF